jgi:hypothetical protein
MRPGQDSGYDAGMKAVLGFLCAVTACGGASTGTGTGTATATASAAATDPAPDNSPLSVGTRHKKTPNGWFLSGGGKDFYDAIYEPGSDPRVVLKQKADPQGHWVTLMKNVAAAPYIGKKIRIRVSVKSQGVTGRSELWARAALPHMPEDAPSTTTKVDETAEMKPYEVTIDVPEGSRVVEYGVSLAGPGEVWVGHDELIAP